MVRRMVFQKVKEAGEPILQGAVRASVLERDFFKEVKVNQAATRQAFLIVVLVAVASGIGSLDEGGLDGLRTLPTEIVLNLVGWVVWASLSYIIGTKLLATPSTQANWSHLARTLGFAQSPGILRILGIIPGLGISISIVTIVWQFIAMVIAVRITLNYESNFRAFGVIALGFIPYLFIVVLLVLLAENQIS